MESIKEILEKRIRPAETGSLQKDAKDKSYIDQETGLKYCLNCKTPLEKEMDFSGERKKVSIPCRCKEERRKEEEKERQKIKRMLLIDSLKRECFDDPIPLNWNFKNMDSDSEHEEIAKNYVENLMKHLKIMWV